MWGATERYGGEIVGTSWGDSSAAAAWGVDRGWEQRESGVRGVGYDVAKSGSVRVVECVLITSSLNS